MVSEEKRFLIEGVALCKEMNLSILIKLFQIIPRYKPSKFQAGKKTVPFLTFGLAFWCSEMYFVTPLSKNKGERACLDGDITDLTQ